MALAPILQMREIVRRGSSEGARGRVEPGFDRLIVGFGLGVAYGVASRDLPLIVPNWVAFLVMSCTITVALDKRRALPAAHRAGPERQG